MTIFKDSEKIEKALGMPLLQAVLKHSSACVILAEAPSGNIVYINDAVKVFRGDTDAPLDGIKIEEYVSTWREFYPDGTLMTGEEMPLARAVLHDEIVNNEEIIVELDNGELRWALASAAPIKDSSGVTIAGIVSWVDITEYKKQQEVLNKVRKEINQLKKLFPICAGCKKVRDDDGYWSQIEVYMTEHYDARFTHGLCPECVAELYPELDE